MSCGALMTTVPRLRAAYEHVVADGQAAGDDERTDAGLDGEVLDVEAIATMTTVRSRSNAEARLWKLSVYIAATTRMWRARFDVGLAGEHGAMNGRAKARERGVDFARAVNLARRREEVLADLEARNEAEAAVVVIHHGQAAEADPRRSGASTT